MSAQQSPSVPPEAAERMRLIAQGRTLLSDGRDADFVLAQLRSGGAVAGDLVVVMQRLVGWPAHQTLAALRSAEAPADGALATAAPPSALRKLRSATLGSAAFTVVSLVVAIVANGSTPGLFVLGDALTCVLSIALVVSATRAPRDGPDGHLRTPSIVLGSVLGIIALVPFALLVLIIVALSNWE